MELTTTLAWPIVVLVLGLAFIALLAVVARRPDCATPPVGPTDTRPVWESRSMQDGPVHVAYEGHPLEIASSTDQNQPELPPIE